MVDQISTLFLYHDKKIVLHPMSPEAIMQDDVARAKKIKSEGHAKVENKNNAKSVFDPKREITLKGKCMLATGCLQISCLCFGLQRCFDFPSQCAAFFASCCC